MIEDQVQQPQPSALFQPACIPEYLLMKAKYPALKTKLNEPFPHAYTAQPIDDIVMSTQLTEAIARLKQDPQAEMAACVPILVGKVEGRLGTTAYAQELAKLTGHDEADYWLNLLKDKISLKYYGPPKSKAHAVYECKDIALLNSHYRTEQIKKYRKITKQYNNLYKALQKFVEKFEAIQSEAHVAQSYELYKKIQTEQSKYSKLAAEKISSPAAMSSTIMIDENAEKVQRQPQMPEIHQIPVAEDQKKDMAAPTPQKMTEEEKEEMNQRMKEEVKSNSEQKNTKKDKQIKTAKKKPEKKQVKQVKSANKQQQISQKYKLLDFFVKKKPTSGENIPEVPELQYPQQSSPSKDKTDIFLEQMSLNLDLSVLRTEFQSQKKKYQGEPRVCYVNIVMKRSRLQYYDFAMCETDKVDFTDPMGETEQVRYDDSSDEYSELVADSINEEMIQEEEESEESESNSAIVSSDFCEYKSSYVFSSGESSDEEADNNVRPLMQKQSNEKWMFNSGSPSAHKVAKFTMLLLCEEETPVMVRDQVEEATNEITLAHKVEMYKELHGSYSPKDVLIKKLIAIAENKISSNKLSNMVKDICDKKATQRILKPEIIKQIAEQCCETNPCMEAEFEELRLEREKCRNQELEAKKEEKMNERDQKIEKLILQFSGPLTLKDILEYLRANQIKLLKHELNQLIKEKQGDKWAEIRDEIRKSKLIRGRPRKEKPLKPDAKEAKAGSHRPIEEIFKQNQLDMINNPDKRSKPKKQQQIVAAEELQEEFRDPEDDESYEINKKPKKRGRKPKKIIMKNNTVSSVPVRRNPHRNKQKRPSHQSHEHNSEPAESQSAQPQQQQVQQSQQQERQQQQVEGSQQQMQPQHRQVQQQQQYAQQMPQKEIPEPARQVQQNRPPADPNCPAGPQEQLAGAQGLLSKPQGQSQ